MTQQAHDKKLFGTATVGSKGQIVIPSTAREELGLETGDKLYIAGSTSKKVLFCLKEEQLQDLIARLTSDVENNERAASVKAQFEELKKE